MYVCTNECTRVKIIISFISTKPVNPTIVPKADGKRRGTKLKDMYLRQLSNLSKVSKKQK